MNAEMRRIVDDYLTRLRRSMRGASADVVAEAEREIRSHIEDGLAERTEPSVDDLLHLLDRLGPPEEFGRDMALYLMVDRGYRDWSLPHMLRSTLFWGLSTLTGAVVIFIFGLLFASAAAIALAEAMSTELLPPGAGERFASLPGGPALLDLARWLPGPLGLLIGPAVMAALVVSIRWFVGQYVSRAEPHVTGGQGAGARWRRAAESRILGIAIFGFGVHVGSGLVAGVYRSGDGPAGWIALDFSRSPMGLVSGLGLLIFLLAPLLGVLRSADR